MPASEWEALFATEELDGTPLALERMPAGIAFIERRPAHHAFAITALDGVRREISVTALPLLSSATELAGVVAVFWQREDGPPQ